MRRIRPLCLLGLLALFGCRAQPSAGARTIRVCAEGENMPFSNSRAEGFEDRIAQLMASELDARVEQITLPAGSVVDRETIAEHRCDVIVGVPRRLGLIPATRPYYRASWVFVTRTGIDPVRSLDDPRLLTMRVGVPTMGHAPDLAPVHALARRKPRSLRAFPVMVDDPRDPAPLAMLRALAASEIDVAILWGPHAGFFADDRSKVQIASVEPEVDHGVPLAYDVAMGARDEALRDELDAFLARRSDQVAAIVRSYGVPQ